jgi:hypothetical protein
MLVNILVMALVIAYCAIVLLGHVLLLVAIWRSRSVFRQTAEDAIPVAVEPTPPLALREERLAA